MKKSLKTILSCCFFLILLIMAIAKCADLLEYKEARKKYSPFFESETNFDVIFMGTSHMWNHILPMELWKEYGISSYNWAYSNCTPAENYYLLQDVLRYTSPKLIVMDVYGLIEYEAYHTDTTNGKYRSDKIEQQHVQFDSLPLSKSKIEAAKDVFDDYPDHADFIWNFIMYHNRWSELNESDFRYDISTEKGAYFLTGLGSAVYKQLENEETISIDSACYPYFLKILEFCEKNNIPVLCTYLPYAAAAEQQRVANTVGPVIQKYDGCSYVNMLNEEIVDFNTDICPDNVHLNYSGAKKTTSWLGQYLTANYDLDDYSQNKSWIKDYQKYYEYKWKNIQSQTMLTDFLSILYDPDFSVQAEISDPKLLDSDKFTSLLENDKIELSKAALDKDTCIRLTVKSNVDGSSQKFEFVCENAQDIQLDKIKIK